LPRSLTVLLLLLASTPGLAQTALDQYVAADDGAYAFEEYDSDPGIGWTTHLLKLTSQRWRGEEDVDCPRRTQGSWLDACDLWQHELILYVPDTIRLGSLGGTDSTAVLVVSGGSNQGEMARSGDDYGGPLAVFANAVVAELRQVPNQPYFFAEEPGRERSEDALLAYTIERFFDTGDPGWPALAPMTKAVVRAMDAVQAFVQDEYDFKVKNFAITGGSKRGWTTWLTAAVDARVKAMMPASIEVNDLVDQLKHHYASYGFFSPATVNYIEANLPCLLERNTAGTLLELIDPNTYKDRYTMPKLLLNSTGDQFFTSDSSRFYYGGLPDPKQLRMAPNTDHKQSSDAIVDGVEWLLDALHDEDPGHHISWSTDPDGTLHVYTDRHEEGVYLWQAHNSVARDFRLESIGKAWTSTHLTKQADGVYELPAEVPATGWSARMVEVRYDSRSVAGLGVLTESYTTEVQVLPDTLPYAPFDCSQPLDVTQGMWWDPATDGQGMDINRFQNTVIFGPWYLYDTIGEPLWVTFTGQLEGTRAKGVLRDVTGPSFGPGFDHDFDPTVVHEREIGQATIAFLGRDHGVFYYGFGAARGGFQGALNIRQFDTRPDGPYSGHWWNPAQAGHGFQFSQKDDVFFGTWYTYDETGQPTWFLFVGDMLDAHSARADMYRFSGPPLSDGPWQHELLQEQPVGEIEVEFPSASQATVDVTVNGVSGHYLLQRF